MPKTKRWTLILLGIVFTLGLAFIPVEIRLRERRTVELVRRMSVDKDTTVINRLLRMGADPNAVESNGQSMTAIAVARRDFNLAELLVRSGARPDAKTQQALQKHRDGRLIQAIDLGKIEGAKQALADGADANCKAWYGGTALEAAIESEDSNIVQLLIQHGADVKQKTQAGLPMVPFALLHGGHLEVISTLKIAGAPSDSVSEYLLAAIRGDLQSVQRHLDSGMPVDALSANNDKWTALFWAAARCQSETVKLLLEHGANPSVRDIEKQTPLEAAMWAEDSSAKAETIALLKAAIRKRGTQ